MAKPILPGGPVGSNPSGTKGKGCPPGYILATVLLCLVYLLIPVLHLQRFSDSVRLARTNIAISLEELQFEYQLAKAKRAPDSAIVQRLAARIKMLNGSSRSPWDPAKPVLSDAILVVSGKDEQGLTQAVAERCTDDGTTQFALQLPNPAQGQKGYLAAAVRYDGPGSSNTIPLD